MASLLIVVLELISLANALKWFSTSLNTRDAYANGWYAYIVFLPRIRRNSQRWMNGAESQQVRISHGLPSHKRTDTSRIWLYNAKEKKKQHFRTGRPVSLYTCGPTLYAPIHLGHARAIVIQDVLRRWLEINGLVGISLKVPHTTFACRCEVRHICNITDTGEGYRKLLSSDSSLVRNEVTLQNEAEFFFSKKALGCKFAEKYPRSSEHIPEIINLVQVLMEHGHAKYEKDGSVYFVSGERQPDDFSPSSKMPENFVLWKKSNVSGWASPWGHGEPGWHMECVAMIIKYFGYNVTIQAGGCDLKFPHHHNTEMLIKLLWSIKKKTRSYSDTSIDIQNLGIDENYVEQNFHHSMVNYSAATSLGSTTKMSKSVPTTVVRPRDACKTDFDYRALRLFLLASHYRKELAFSFSALRNTKLLLRRLDSCLLKVAELYHTSSTYNETQNITKTPNNKEFSRSSKLLKLVKTWLLHFSEALNNDLSVHRTLRLLLQIVDYIENKEIVNSLGPTDLELLLSIFLTMDEVLVIWNFNEALKDRIKTFWQNDFEYVSLPGIRGVFKNTVSFLSHSGDGTKLLVRELCNRYKNQWHIKFGTKPLDNNEPSVDCKTVFGSSETTSKRVGIPESVLDIVAQRHTAKRHEDYLISDQLRKRINEAGFGLRDISNNEYIMYHLI